MHPSDLKSLSIDELKELATELRVTITNSLTKTGGHLASNLGIVEITLALHREFHSPNDKIIFDTSHQSYIHKIVTGRGPQLDTIRQFKGLSGFCDPGESVFDHFYSGHAGSALSLGLGVAHKRDLLDEEFYVLPVLGDASFTCGLTLEALNNMHDYKNLIIILNDNDMSISHSVGRINVLLKDAKKTENFFSAFGLNYLGPIDGHDLSSLVDTINIAKNINGPVVIHAKTIKGHGLDYASEKPIKYHGVKPFDYKTGAFYQTSLLKPTFPKIFGKHLLKMAEKDSTIVATPPAMPSGSCLTEFMEKYPKRCLDVGIAEGHCVSFAGGLAYGKKLKVVASVYSTFLQRALDNVFQDVCLQNLPVLFALDRGGIAGGDGITHNGIYEISFLAALPNMVIAQPRDGHLLKELMSSAFSYNKPVTIRYPNLPTEDNITPLMPRPIGKGEVLKMGKEIAILALGHLTELAMQIDLILQEENIKVTIIDPIFIKPLDTELLDQIISSHSIIITLEEHALINGFGSLINSYVMNSKSKAKVKNFGIPDEYIEHGSYKDLMNSLDLTPRAIAGQIISLKRDLCDYSLIS